MKEKYNPTNNEEEQEQDNNVITPPECEFHSECRPRLPPRSKYHIYCHYVRTRYWSAMRRIVSLIERPPCGRGMSLWSSSLYLSFICPRGSSILGLDIFLQWWWGRFKRNNIRLHVRINCAGAGTLCDYLNEYHTEWLYSERVSILRCRGELQLPRI